MEENATISNREELEKAKSRLMVEIKEHQKEADLFHQQVKMFLRQGLDELPQKQQNIYQAIQAKEKDLQKRLSQLEEISKKLSRK